tara:strand:- start:155 stop:403 length:249 start_codon:yes stop_codon:yes gene_type:complete
MLEIERSDKFMSAISKIRNKEEQEKVKKKINKVINNPEIGKPMQHGRKGTREIYIGSFRLSYANHKDKNKIIFLDIYHKDEQ